MMYERNGLLMNDEWTKWAIMEWWTNEIKKINEAS